MSSSPAPSRALARSCAICAQRKVRCDKQYPCGRCTNAGVTCVLPPIDPRPRWARRLVRPEPHSNDAEQASAGATTAGVGVDSMLDRLKHLEGLVQGLTGELQEARAAVAASQQTSGPSSTSSTPAGSVGTGPSPAGRVILDGSNNVRYVSNGFWSRVDHELDSLKQDTLGYEDDGPEAASEEAQTQSKSSKSSAREDAGTLRQGYTFLWNSSMSSAGSDTSLLPMVSQIPFLLEAYAERVHSIICVPHMPSLQKLLRNSRSRQVASPEPSEEATIFAVFYAAICSLDDDEVASSFNNSRSELAFRYRVGLEGALARADFLNNPSYVLLEALVIYLTLARRHDSPKHAWMMIGLVIRMAHFLGLHHDSADSKHVSPFQVEMHRRLWWNICVLDIQATEDQGTELALLPGSYSTKLPSNIGESGIWPEMKQLPPEYEGLTSVSLLRLCSKVTRATQAMMATGAEGTSSNHHHRLSDLTQELERDYFSVADESRDPIYGAVVGFMRIALGRLYLLSCYPALFSSTSDLSSKEIRTKSLVAAIEIAEHNHALNDKPSYQPWRWVFQTQRHWHAVVFILIEICRRPWSHVSERAWLALQSPWLVPARAPIDKNFSVWVPLRRLMARVRKYRHDEIARLQADPRAAATVEDEARQQTPLPSSSSTFPVYFNDEWFYERWRQLVCPIATTTEGSLNRMDVTLTSNNNESQMSLDTYPAYSAMTNKIGETPSPMRAALSAAAANFSNSDITFPTTALQPGTHTSSVQSVNLDTFLGTEMEMGFLEDMDVGDFTDFDWTTWLESTKGSL